MGKKVLGISWLHGRFYAVDLSAGPSSPGWTAPLPVNTASEFASALGQAVRETGFRGQRVSVVIDHRNLLFHVQEVPPAKGKVLQKLLDRLVAQNQFFDEPAASAHVELPPGKALHRHLLSLLPQSLVASVIDACSQEGLRLESLWPAAAVVASRLQKLPAPPNEIFILATAFGESMNLLLGRSDGKLLFSRTVVVGGTVQVERAAQEINRTLHYAQQQFGALVNLLFISGTQAFTALKESSIRAGLQIQEAPADESQSGLVQLATVLSPRGPLNFARHNTSRSPAVRAVAAAGIAAALVASLFATVQVEMKIHAREKEARAAQDRLSREAESQAAAIALNMEAHRLRTILGMVGSTNDPPVIELFARHLPTLLTPAFRLTGVQIEEGLVGWRVKIQGMTRLDSAALTAGLEKLEQDLERGIFNVKITDSSYQQLFRGELDLAMPPSARSEVRSTETPFFVTGVIE